MQNDYRSTSDRDRHTLVFRAQFWIRNGRQSRHQQWGIICYIVKTTQLFQEPHNDLAAYSPPSPNLFGMRFSILNFKSAAERKMPWANLP